MAWNKIGNLAAFSLALILAACGGDSGSNASNGNVNSGHSVSNENLNSCASSELSGVSINSSSLDTNSVRYIYEDFNSFVKNELQLTSKLVNCRIKKAEILRTEVALVPEDPVECMCGGYSWSAYEKSTNTFFYCNKDVLGNWLLQPIQNGDGVAIRNDGIAYKIFIDGRDGNDYAMGLVGGNIWMLQDLRFDVGEDDFCFYSYSGDSTKKNDLCDLGRRYSATTALGVNGINKSGICPQGWHIPDTSEWKTVTVMPRIAPWDYYVADRLSILEKGRNWNEIKPTLKSSEGYWSSTYNENVHNFYRATVSSTGVGFITGDRGIRDVWNNPPVDTFLVITGVRCMKDDNIW